MIVQFSKWGNSVALRIPKAFAQEIHARDGSVADLTLKNGKLIITPVDDTPVYDLNDLLAGITNENFHGETDTGSAVGNEFE